MKSISNAPLYGGGVIPWTPTNLDGEVTIIDCTFYQITENLFYLSFWGSAARDQWGYTHLSLPKKAINSHFMLTTFEANAAYISDNYAYLTINHNDDTTNFGVTGIYYGTDI